MAHKIRLLGTQGSGYVSHNIELANPMNPIAKEIKKITSKGTRQTDEDRETIAKLEFSGSLYMNGKGPCIPAANIKACFTEAAKISRAGKKIERGIFPTVIEPLIVYSGPKDIDGLWKSGKFRYNAIVNVQGSRIVRCRPIFREWSLELMMEIIPTVIDLEEFKSIANLAGVAIGLGDNRKNGYGRFAVEIA
jgi:hypothetical protein